MVQSANARQARYAVVSGYIELDGHAGTVLSPEAESMYRQVRQSEIAASAMPKLELHYTEWSIPPIGFRTNARRNPTCADLRSRCTTISPAFFRSHDRQAILSNERSVVTPARASATAAPPRAAPTLRLSRSLPGARREAGERPSVYVPPFPFLRTQHENYDS